MRHPVESDHHVLCRLWALDPLHPCVPAREPVEVDQEVPVRVRVVGVYRGHPLRTRHRHVDVHAVEVPRADTVVVKDLMKDLTGLVEDW